MIQEPVLGKKNPQYGGCGASNHIKIYFQYFNGNFEYIIKINARQYIKFRKLTKHLPLKCNPETLAKIILSELEESKYSKTLNMLSYWTINLLIIPVKASQKAHLGKISFLIGDALSSYILEKHDTPTMPQLWEWLRNGYMFTWENDKWIISEEPKKQEKSLKTLIKATNNESKRSLLFRGYNDISSNIDRIQYRTFGTFFLRNVNTTCRV